VNVGIQKIVNIFKVFHCDAMPSLCEMKFFTCFNLVFLWNIIISIGISQKIFNTITWKHVSQQASAQVSEGSALDGTAIAMVHSTASDLTFAILFGLKYIIINYINQNSPLLCLLLTLLEVVQTWTTYLCNEGLNSVIFALLLCSSTDYKYKMSVVNTRGQCYKTFYGRKLRLFIIS